jgi:hypothetical protein
MSCFGAPAQLPTFEPPHHDCRLAALRTLIAEKFATPTIAVGGILATGFDAFDQTEGGLRRGALTEVTGPPSSGALFLAVLLALLRREKSFGALVDGGRTFDPQGADFRSLRRLLWVSCGDAHSAVKAADLLLRDGNLPMIAVDLQRISARELQRIPASTWHRFQRVVEQTNIALVVLTTLPIVEGARVRIAVKNRWELAVMRQRRRSLLNRIEAQVFVRRTLGSPQLLERRSA